MGTTILGMGHYHPSTTVEFDSGTRYRSLPGTETQLGMGVKAALEALKNAGIGIDKIDMIIAACAIFIQPIPCNAALFHEALGAPQGVAAMDICTTCTSFITALDVADMMIKSGRRKRILIISSDIPSIALNPDEEESYTLFSDAAAAAVVGEGEGCLINACQYTYSSDAHSTEIRYGGSAHPAFEYTEEDINNYRFTMNGYATIKGVLKVFPKHLSEFLESNELTLNDIDLIIPHQASHALDYIMKKIKMPKEKYFNVFPEYGNMVSASVPFALSLAMQEGKVKRGQRLVLAGTAAGLTINFLVMQL